jgi:hypothetical protein
LIKFIECIEYLKEHKNDIKKGYKYNYPANFIYKGNSLCKEHLLKILYNWESYAAVNGIQWRKKK